MRMDVVDTTVEENDKSEIQRSNQVGSRGSVDPLANKRQQDS